MIKLQDKVIDILQAVEIDDACNRLRLFLAELKWISHPYHIAQRFYRRENNRTFYYPETYAKGEDKHKPYHRLTPDNDYSGMFFFYVGDEQNTNYANFNNNHLSYPVAIIFSCNLALIDKEKLKTALFTQELIREVRQKLTRGAANFDFTYTIDRVTRDLRTVYREFTLDDIEQYNRAPLQCFRIDLTLTLQEQC